jgi:hypothetical protein
MKRALNLAFALEMLSVGLIQYTLYDTTRSELIYNSLNALIDYVHNNCISFLELIYHFLSLSNPKNTSITAIHTILMNRKNTVCELADLSKIIQGRNEAIKKLINKVIKFKTGPKVFSNGKTKKSVQSLLEKVLQDIDMCAVDLHLVCESIKQATKELPRTVVKQGPTSLSVVKSPFLPVKTTEKAYTLVLDLDETLVHYCDVLFIHKNLG